MDPRHKKVEGDHWERSEDGLDKRFAPSAMLRCSAMHTVQQLGGCDGGNGHVLAIAQLSF